MNQQIYWQSLKGQRIGRWLKIQPFTEERTCPICHSKFTVNGSTREQRYCSRTCYHKDPKIRQIRVNAHIGNRNSSKKLEVRSKISASIKRIWDTTGQYGMKGKRHTQASIDKIRKNTPVRTGIRHHNWRGGITPQSLLGRQSAKYHKWRKEVLNRDAHRCRVKDCNESNRVIAHHIFEFAAYPDMRYSVDNGITICRKHHNQKHRGVVLQFA